MKRTLEVLFIASIFCFLVPVIVQAQTACLIDPVTGNAMAQMITPTNGSTLPAGAVTFQWCNANADYFLTIESIVGAHDIFFAFVGGVGPGAGVVSITLGPACATIPPIGCIPAKGETIHVVLDSVRSKTILSSFTYTYTAASSAPPDNTMTFHLPPDGTSVTSSGVGPLEVRYGQMTSSMTTNPVAIANFGYSSGVAGTGALVTEAGVPAATAVTAARLFVDYATDPNTGLVLTNSGFAVVNPNNTAITIGAALKDAKGITMASSSIPLGPRSHTALFVNQLALPLPLPSPFLGTLTLTSASGFAAVNLSSATSGRGEMLFSALPVADLGNPPRGTQLILSQIVDGNGNPTQIMLMNPSATTQSVGKVQLFDDTGAPLALDFGNPSGPQNSLDFTLAPDGMVKFATTGIGALHVGYAVVTVSSGPLPVGNGIFQFREVSGLASQAGVPDSPQTTSARLYVEVASAPLNRNTGIAVVNRNATASTLTLTLNGFDGSTRMALPLILGPNAHAASYITQLFTGLPANFSGVLNITSTQPSSFLTLRQTINERGESIWSTLPVADLNNAPQGIQILPQIVNGGLYKTQTIVISTSTGPGTVSINFFDESGISVPLTALF
ncbi:MAG: hypothetical protein WBN92_02175 [Terriglobia bacterium]